MTDETATTVAALNRDAANPRARVLLFEARGGATSTTPHEPGRVLGYRTAVQLLDERWCKYRRHLHAQRQTANQTSPDQEFGP